VAEILTPRLALDLRNPGLVFSAWYAARIFWEDPHPPSASATLILHTFGLTLDARRFRSVVVTASAIGSIGEPDYTTLAGMLGGIQPTLPPVVDVATVDGQARVAVNLTERWGMSLGGRVTYWQWLDISPGTVMPPGTVTSQTSVTAEPATRYLLTTRDALGLAAGLGWVSYSYGAGAFTISPVATWRSRLDRGTDLNARLGFTYVHALGSPPPGVTPLLGVGRTEAVSPIGSVEVIVHLLRRDEIVFLGRGSAVVDFYLDPVLGTAVPRGTAVAELSAVTAPSWTITLRGEFATALESVPPLPGGPPDETAFTVSLAARRRVTENFYAELGGRWANRGPTLDTPGFRFDQPQLWAYLSLTATTRPIPRPTLPRD